MSLNELTFYHAANTRSSASLILLEELGASYDLHVLDMGAGENQRAAYRAINPLGKVPALRHGDVLITEQVALYIYLADLFPERGLTPMVGDPERGSYLRWLVYYAAAYEPAFVDKAMKRDPAPHARSPYGTFDEMLETVFNEIRAKPFLLGDRLSAADILWGTVLSWGMGAGLVPEERAVGEYVARITQRPASLKVAALNDAIEAGIVTAGLRHSSQPIPI
ncbi:glutathione S-transferase family protein [Sphingopyxis sp.]|uniref:glutathione S-transferase family protein n=1 Tax=Sphingopyxis sp. TaxID=1908224 RepID=UPI002D767663|nr:glutathione S-transferase family protein [Sphingopyxis sp.]HET6522870.1 glutathione S-transferase family protein [Sphingopyxis sp.]